MSYLRSLRTLLGALCAVSLILLAAEPGRAEVRADVALSCVPSTDGAKIPNRRVGQAMSVELELSNENCLESVDYGKVAVGLVGNGGNTLANVAIFGPYRRNYTGTIPPAECTPMGQCTAPEENMYEACSTNSDCDFVGGDGVCEINYYQLDTPSTTTQIILVTDSMPPELEGTVAAAIVSVDFDGGHGFRTGEEAVCKVNVLP